MPLTPGDVGHTTIAGEDRIRVFDNGGSVLTQGMALVDDSDSHAGVGINPLRAEPSRPTSRYVSSALEDSAVVKASAGVLKELVVVLSAAAVARFLHVFDQSGALSGGETPVMRLLVPAGGMASYTPPGGLVLSTGLVVGVSSTLATYTASGDSLAAFHADYD